MSFVIIYSDYEDSCFDAGLLAYFVAMRAVSRAALVSVSGKAIPRISMSSMIFSDMFDKDVKTG